MATLPVQIVSSLKRTLPFLHYSHESFLFFEVPSRIKDTCEILLLDRVTGWKHSLLETNIAIFLKSVDLRVLVATPNGLYDDLPIS
jgi:hypothetical protein